MTEERAYPLEIRGEMSPDLSRWLWLVKWLLIIPHLIVLLVLSIVSIILTIVAFFAILFTGKYPRGVFNFNVNVLRWKWRVLFYSYLALGTDRYPPFSLTPDDYPANLEVEYPERLSRLKVLFKWWLLAIPHYILLEALFVLAFTLTIFAGIVMLFRGYYPRDMFEVIMGLDRWMLRVAGYVTLLYDDYPPFRFRP